MARPRGASSAFLTGIDHGKPSHDISDGRQTTSIYSSLSSVFLDTKFSDMTITCKGQEFKAHKAIVCTQSPFFNAALCGTFKEATTGIVDLPDDDPAVVKAFLQFLYLGNYDDGVVPTYGRPALVASMDRESIAVKLSSPIGIKVPLAFTKDESSSATRTKDARGQSRNSGSQGDVAGSFDSDYEPESPASSGGLSDDTDQSQHLTVNELTVEKNGPGYAKDDDNHYITDMDNECSARKGDQAARHTTRVVPPGDVEFCKVNQRGRNDMIFSLRVYIMADKFDVPALKLLARQRFYRAVEMGWEVSDKFIAAVDVLYSNTPDTETVLREIVCRLVGSNIARPEVRERMKPMMQTHGGFAVGVMEYMLAHGHSGRY